MKKSILLLLFIIACQLVYSQLTTENYDLVYQKIHWQVDPAKRFIKGQVTFHIIPNKDLNRLSFDLANELTIISIEYNSKEIEFTHRNEKCSFSLEQFMVAAKIDSFIVKYHGVPPDNRAFTQTEHNGMPIIWTLSEPYGAKDWWPCKQSLNDKIDSLDIFVTTPTQYSVASNGVLMSETVTDGQKTTYWKHRHPIAAYLVAIAVTNYVKHSDFVPIGNDSIEVVNYLYPEDLGELKEKTKRVIPVMKLFNEILIPYPFKDEKYGHAQFGWGGGMEHQTMSFMGDFSHELIAHELAHQWFGNYVTCGSWKDIWINEGFASYLTGLTYEHMFDGMYWDKWKSTRLESVISSPSGSIYVDDTTSVERVFDMRLSYRKAALFLHTLRWEIGDDAFFTALKNILTDKKLVNNYANTEQIRKHFEATSGKTLQGFFDDWIYGQGYPIFEPEWHQDENKTVFFNLKQYQTHPSVELFETKLPVLFLNHETDTIVVLYNDKPEQDFVFKLDFMAERIIIDPEKWIITKIPDYLKDISEKSNIIAFPNPVKDMLHISNPSGKILKITVFDVLGRLYRKYSGNFKQPLHSISVQDLQKGLYFVYIETETGEYTKRILKN